MPAGAGADGDGDKGGGAEAAEAAAAHQQPGGPAALTGDGAAREGASAAGAAGAGGRFLGTRENYIVQRYIHKPLLLDGIKLRPNAHANADPRISRPEQPLARGTRRVQLVQSGHVSSLPPY